MISQGFKLYRGKGCETCNNTGYKGRVGIYEVMEVDRGVEEAILNNKAEHEIEELAVEQGMVTLLQDGYLKCLKGFTTVEQIYKLANG